MISEAELSRLNTIAVEACKTASEEVNRVAILYGTQVIIERDGKVVEVEPSLDAVLFRVIDSGAN